MSYNEYLLSPHNDFNFYQYNSKEKARKYIDDLFNQNSQ
jgi:hypothetical protein